MRRLAALALIAIAPLAACGEDRAPETDATRVPGPTDTLIVYERTGGEEGARERLAIRPDGAARITDRDKSKRVQLSIGELNSLQDARLTVDFERLDSTYGDANQVVADGYETTLTADGRSVKILHDAKVPPELERLRATSASFLEKYRPR
jgi:hypothetical protein